MPSKATATTLDCDMVVISAGIRPTRKSPRDAGLDGRARRSSSTIRCALPTPDIYAVGECAQHRGSVYGLVAPLWEQAKVLADHLTGANTGRRLPRLEVATKLKVMGVELGVDGRHREPHGERRRVVQFSEPAQASTRS